MESILSTFMWISQHQTQASRLMWQASLLTTEPSCWPKSVVFSKIKLKSPCPKMWKPKLSKIVKHIHLRCPCIPHLNFLFIFWMFWDRPFWSPIWAQIHGVDQGCPGTECPASTSQVLELQVLFTKTLSSELECQLFQLHMSPSKMSLSVCSALLLKHTCRSMDVIL